MIAYKYLWLLFLFHDILCVMFGVWDEERDNFSNFLIILFIQNVYWPFRFVLAQL